MSLFDRLKRLARSEITEIKRVLSERDGPAASDPRTAAEREENERQRLIREAEEELARAEHDVLASEIDAGASLWGDPAAPGAASSAAPEPGGPFTRSDIARGASLWGAPEPEPARAQPEPRTARTPTSPPYEGRTHAFPREVRDAYAALEIPLGADRVAVEAAFREMLHRFHPDKHAGDPRREAMAHDLTIRIREARAVLLTWLDTGRLPTS